MFFIITIRFFWLGAFSARSTGSPYSGGLDDWRGTALGNRNLTWLLVFGLNQL